MTLKSIINEINTRINAYKKSLNVDSIFSRETLKLIINEINTRINAYKKSLNVDFNIFIHNENVDLSYIDKPCNIVLSPVFYWVKRESLPVSSESKASKLALSCFGSQVPDGEYKYFAIKDNDDFILFAYDSQKILDTLKNSNLDLSLVSKIYLAQNEFTNDIITIDDDKCLYNRDDIYVVLPKSLLKADVEIESLEFSLNNIKKSKHNLNISLNDGMLDSKYINILVISISIIAFSLATRYFVLKDDYNKVIKQERTIINKYKIPTSSLQLKSIKKSLEKKLSQEIKIKENIQNLFDIPLKTGDFMRDIDIRDGQFILAISIKESDDNKSKEEELKGAEDYKQYLLKYFELNSLRIQDNILSIKGEF